MAKGILLFVLGVLVGAISIYFLLNMGFSSQSLNNQGQGVLPNSCISQINSAINIVKAKLPAGALVSIVNTTLFGTVSSNQEAATVQSWANEWWEVSFGGLAPYNNCNSGGGVEAVYFCTDLNSAKNSSMSVEGVAIKIEANVGSGTTTVVVPVLCGNGELLPASANYIKTEGAG